VRHEFVDHIKDEAEQDGKKDGCAEGKIEMEIFLFNLDIEGKIADPVKPVRRSGFSCGHEKQSEKHGGKTSDDKYFSGFRKHGLDIF
jgi:hypothetical protein